MRAGMTQRLPGVCHRGWRGPGRQRMRLRNTSSGADSPATASLKPASRASNPSVEYFSRGETLEDVRRPQVD